MDIPDELKYSKEHLWVRVEGDSAVVGITDFARGELGAISGLELPEKGDELDQDDSVGSIEARKTVAEIYAPFSGTVEEINHEVIDTPALLDDDPYDSGWLMVVTINDSEEFKGLMSADDYAEYVENLD